MLPLDGGNEIIYTMFMESNSGSKHYGAYITLSNQTNVQLLKSIKSYQSNVAAHKIKINNPSSFVTDWVNRDKRYHDGILRKWNADIDRNQELFNIAMAIANERGLSV